MLSFLDHVYQRLPTSRDVQRRASLQNEATCIRPLHFSFRQWFPLINAPRIHNNPFLTYSLASCQFALQAHSWPFVPLATASIYIERIPGIQPIWIYPSHGLTTRSLPGDLLLTSSFVSVGKRRAMIKHCVYRRDLETIRYSKRFALDRSLTVNPGSYFLCWLLKVM